VAARSVARLRPSRRPLQQQPIGTRVSIAGAVLDPDFAIANAADEEGAATLAAGTAPAFLVAYTRYDAASSVTAYRVKARIVSFP
jgi:hypothetical protein